jgi:outer membrane protein OmpA-like peptidoglycan-associated protein
MFKQILQMTLALSLFVSQAYAMELPRSPATNKENTGFGIGAIIGGLLAGLPGIVIGAAGGTWFGAHDSEKDDKIAALAKRLQDKEVELAYLQSEFSRTRSKFASDLQNVKLEKGKTALEQLSNGISLAIYFRTNSADITPETLPRIKRLVTFIGQFPEIHLQLEGHADRRGSNAHNMRLSQKRINTVKNELVNAGFLLQHIHTHAYGETQAATGGDDIEGFIFDRKVIIQLTLDTEV